MSPLPIDAVCIFGQTTENDIPMLESAARIQIAGIAELVAVTGFKGEKNGVFEVRSSDAFKKMLTEFGVPKENLISFPLSDKLPPARTRRQLE